MKGQKAQALHEESVRLCGDCGRAGVLAGSVAGSGGAVSRALRTECEEQRDGPAHSHGQGSGDAGLARGPRQGHTDERDRADMGKGSGEAVKRQPRILCWAWRREWWSGRRTQYHWSRDRASV